MTAEELQKWRTVKQQNLPFDFYEEEEQQKKIEEEKRKAAEAELIDSMPYFENPRNDNEKLLNFQYEYKHGNEEALNKMYCLSKEICAKYVNTITHSNRKVKHLCEFDKETKAQNAATYMIEQFMTRPDFVIKGYATAYLWLRVIKELFYHTKADELIDYVDIRAFFKEGTEDEEEEIENEKYIKTEDKEILDFIRFN